jgi:hypothetical protein
MAIIASDAPRAALDAVRNGLIAKIRAGSLTSPKLIRAVTLANDLSISFPHRAAFLSRDAIKRESALRDAAEIGIGNWRFLVLEEEPMKAGQGRDHESMPACIAIAAASAAVTEDENYKLGEINEGPFVEGTCKAVEDAQKLETVKTGSFEVVLLLAPAIYVAALWLRNRDGGADIILTIPPSDARLVPFQPMNSRDFMNVLRQIDKNSR